MNVSRIIQNLAVAVVVMLALLLTFSIFSIPGNYRLLVVSSGSMEPAIKTGSLVVVKPQEEYKPEEIITFQDKQNPKILNTHRIVDKLIEKETGKIEFITRGDANKAEDLAAVSPYDIIGKVEFSIPFLGFLVNFVKQPTGFFLLIILPATLIICEEIRKIKDEVTKLRQKKTLASLFLFSLSLVFLNYTRAYVSDKEVSTGNIFQATTWSSLYLSPGYTCANGATSREKEYGRVIIKVSQGTLSASVTLIGATSNSNYDIWINQHPGACPLNSPSFPDGLRTDANGDGQASFSISKIATATKFWISAVGGGQILRSVAIEEKL